MATVDAFSFSVEKFNGVARLFPLPNLVMFPHVVQPLHVFEQRYRDLLEATLADDGLIAMGFLEPGWEADYEARPPVSPIVCLGRVLAHRRAEDGHYNILLAGLRRARIVQELKPTHSYREVQLEILPEIYPTSGGILRPTLRNSLMSRFRDLAPYLASHEDPLDELLEGDVPLDVLTDLVSFSMDLDLSQKLELLAETDVDLRARRLDACIAGRLQHQLLRRFVYPPTFGLN